MSISTAVRQLDDAKILLKLTVVHAKRKNTFVCINLSNLGIFSTYYICVIDSGTLIKKKTSMFKGSPGYKLGHVVKFCEA